MRSELLTNICQVNGIFWDLFMSQCLWALQNRWKQINQFNVSLLYIFRNLSFSFRFQNKLTLFLQIFGSLCITMWTHILKIELKNISFNFNMGKLSFVHSKLNNGKNGFSKIESSIVYSRHCKDLTFCTVFQNRITQQYIRTWGCFV